LGARRQDRIQALAKDLTSSGGKALAMPTDVADRQQAKNLVDAAVEAYGRVDVMINNAGLMPQALLERLQVDEWERRDRLKIGGARADRVNSGLFLDLGWTGGLDLTVGENRR
jgi:NADP-dependent 3-hydroxy acid dehydrogenase YdfG